MRLLTPVLVLVILLGALASPAAALSEPAPAAPLAASDHLVLVRGNRWFVRDGLPGGTATLRPAVPRARPLIGDWDGDAVPTPASSDGRRWTVTDTLAGRGERTFAFGRPGDVPIAGDWNGDGTDGIGVVRDGHWHLAAVARGGVAARSFGYGRPGDIPVVGDWNGDGVDDIGVVRQNRWYLRLGQRRGAARWSFWYGKADDVPVVGDWDGDGRDEPAIRRGNVVHARTALTGGPADITIGYGRESDVPLTWPSLATVTRSCPSGAFADPRPLVNEVVPPDEELDRARPADAITTDLGRTLAEAARYLLGRRPSRYASPDDGRLLDL